MRKSIIWMLCLVLVLSVTSCGSNNKEVGETPTAVNMDAIQSAEVGAVPPEIDFVGEKNVIMHSPLGLFVYEVDTLKLVQTIDLSKIDCNYMQGDIVTKIQVSKNEEEIYIFNDYSADIKDKKEVYYKYNIKENKLVTVEKEDVNGTTSTQKASSEYDSSTIFDTYQNLSFVTEGPDGRLYFTTSDDEIMGNIKLVVSNVQKTEVKEYLIFNK